MKGEELLERFGEIDPAYIEAADKEPARKRHSWIKWTLAAAALCAVVALGVVRRVFCAVYFVLRSMRGALYPLC